MWKCKEWWNIELTLGICCGPLIQHLLPTARHQPHLLIPSAETINQKKAKNPEMRFNSQQIVSYCLNNASFVIDILSFLVQNFNPINLDRKLDNENERLHVRMLWDKCLPHAMARFIYLSGNYNILGKIITF